MKRWGWIIAATGLLLAGLAGARIHESPRPAIPRPDSRHVAPPVFAVAFGLMMAFAGGLIRRDGRRFERRHGEERARRDATPR